MAAFAAGLWALVTTWQLWAGLLALAGTTGLLMVACARENASEDTSDDGANGFRGSFGGDQGASDE